jgi:hypothetical protein
MDRFEPSARPLLNAGRTDGQNRHDAPTGRLPQKGPQSHGEQAVSHIASVHDDQATMQQSQKHHPTTVARNHPSLTRSFHVVNQLWSKSWTVETCSLVVSILTLAGLAATLLTHQHKPLPQWPKLVNINSIISLFSLLMRSCVGVVLAEGMLRLSSVRANVINVCCRDQSVQMELVQESPEIASH